MAAPIQQYLGTGRRKTAIARVFLRPGKGQIVINKLPIEFPSIDILAIHSDYIRGIRMVEVILNKDVGAIEFFNKLVIFLGSSIGNFEPNEASAFLQQIRSSIGNSTNNKFLIGFDLHKDAEILEAAYNDRNGITAKFNLNILARINRELGGEFDLNTFYHSAFYNLMKRLFQIWFSIIKSILN